MAPFANGNLKVRSRSVLIAQTVQELEKCLMLMEYEETWAVV